MALSKITLTLGKGKSKQKISLTPSQFEELKQDMRDLDKSHHYYWDRNPWYQPWYTLLSTTGSVGTTFTTTGTTPLTIDCSSNAVSAFTTASYDEKNELNYVKQCQALNEDPSPPSFQGKVLSAK